MAWYRIDGTLREINAHMRARTHTHRSISHFSTNIRRRSDRVKHLLMTGWLSGKEETHTISRPLPFVTRSPAAVFRVATVTLTDTQEVVLRILALDFGGARNLDEVAAACRRGYQVMITGVAIEW